MDFMKFLTDQLSNPETLRTMGQNVQAKPAQVKQITELGIPALLQAINRNASTQQGANSLLKALEQHQDDKVDDIPNFLNQIDRNDANKMLQHILGGKKEKVEMTLAKQTGLQDNQISGLLTQLAPLIMGALAQQKKQQNVSVNDLSGLLNGISSQTTQKMNPNFMNMLTDLLDADNDGSIVDEVGGFLKGIMNKK